MTTPWLNLVFGWCWVFLGLLTGTAQGLFFHRDDWLAGYASWRRRMIRLGHIAFFGTGFLNLCFAWTCVSTGLAGSRALTGGIFGISGVPGLPGVPGVPGVPGALLVGAAAMPTVCYLSAWRRPARHLFFIPVLSLLAGVGGIGWMLLLR